MVKKIIKWICYSFIIIVVALIIFRIALSDSSSVFKDITPTDAAKTAFSSDGEILTHRMIQSIADDGIMRCYSFVYIPEAKQIQVTVKFNKSIHDTVSESEQFDFKLYNTETESQIWASSVERAEKGLYKYCRVVFDGVDFKEGDSLEIIMANAEHTDEYSVYKLHESYTDFENYKLSRRERNSLGG